jgi:hypothetical protein
MTVNVKTGYQRVTGYFQVNNKFYFIEADSLKSIDFNGNISFIADLNYTEVWGAVVNHFYPAGWTRNKCCIPISQDLIFIADSNGRGLFVNLKTLKIDLFIPGGSSFGNSLNYYYDGKAIYHTRTIPIINTTTMSSGFYSEKIMVGNK